MTDRLSIMTRTETSTSKESANPKENSESTDKAEIMEILNDSEKFQAHIQEIDDALINGPAIPSVTNATNDDRDCRTKELANNTLTRLGSGGLAMEFSLDQGPQPMVNSGSGPINVDLSPNGPMTNNLTPRTWKRVLTGPKIINPTSEDAHAGIKRGAHDHANTDMVSTSKKKKMDIEVVEISNLLAMEFTETAVVARQHRRD